MRLRPVPAAQGLVWVRLGARTFMRQPLAMAGLFFMFMAVVSVLSVIPVIGSVAAIVLVPSATIGLMAASREAHEGRFPMPALLVTAFRGGLDKSKPMLVLGVIYAVIVALLMGAAMLVGPGDAPAVGADAEVTPEMLRQAMFGPDMVVMMLLYVPVLMAFWHAPALVHWHGVPPVKSLFFSALACWRNKGAMLVYGAGWLGVFLLGGLATSFLASLMGGSAGLAMILYPAVLLMAAMFHTSVYFTFRDSFDADTPAADDASVSSGNA
ncbi:MAG: BPSS1780 family membrane protein [Burkholderiaceae bacterium]